MAKGKGKNPNYWRNKIKKERQQPKARFRGRVRSKGESRTRTKYKAPQKGQKWTNRVGSSKAYSKAKTKPVPKVRTNQNRFQSYSKFKAKSLPARRPTISRQSSRLKNRITASKPITKPVANKNSLQLLKNRSTVVKSTKPNPSTQKPSAGAAKLKSIAMKNMPAKSPTKSVATPSKGAALLKKSASKIVNQPKPAKKAKQPVIRRGR